MKRSREIRRLAQTLYSAYTRDPLLYTKEWRRIPSREKQGWIRVARAVKRRLDKATQPSSLSVDTTESSA